MSIGSFLSAPTHVHIGELPPELKGKKVKFKSKTGRQIAAWFIPGHDEQGGILLMHGLRSNRTQMTQRAVFLNQAGYSVLLFDFQAHGESPGDNLTFGYLESQDAEAAFDYLMSQIKNKSVGVIGVSLGGVSALLSSTAQRANAVIIEAVYPTLEQAVQNRMTIRLGKLGQFLSPLLLWQIQPRLGFNPDDLKPIEHLATLKTPLLIMAGTNDQHTTLSESKSMYNMASEPKELWLVNGAKHQDFERFSSVEYQQKVLRFFKKNL